MADIPDFAKLRNACCGENQASKECKAKQITNGKITEGNIYRISANEEVDGVTYGVDGILCVDKSNINNRLFIPLTGRLYNQKVGTGFVFIWSSTYDSDQYAKFFGMSGSGSKYVVTNFVIGNAIDYRYYGQAVRPVYKYNY